MKAVLLAAGLGKRLLPITKSIPKPMIMIAGKPLLEYIIEDLTKSGFDEICLVVGHLRNHIEDYFKDGSKYNVKISYVIQHDFVGTASATKLTKSFVNEEPFLLYLADTIIPYNLEENLQRIISNDSEIGLLSAKIQKNNIKNVGNIEVKDDFVIKINEKSLDSKSDLGWAGVAFFKSNYIFEIIDELNPSFRNEFEITEAMNLMLNHNRKIRNYICEKYIDAGTISGILELNNFILNQHKFSRNHIPKTLQNELKNPVYIGTNCDIDDNVSIGPFVSIGNDVLIDANVKIEQSVIMDGAQISPNQKISHSLVSIDGKISL